jgi:hypothetical protein
MMMRTIEILFTVIILFSAFMVVSYFAILPSPRLTSSTSLRELASSTLGTIDANGELSKTAFASPSDPSWTSLQIALSASLPPNIVYNLTVYDIVTSPDGVVTYRLVRSLSDAQGDLGVGSDSSSHIVTSSNVTFTVNPQKIGESSGKNITLYILNCNDANGWWITGYSGQSLASDLYNLLSPYFQKTVLVNSTFQLGLLLNGTALKGENLQHAVVINTFGEAVPIPAGYYTTQGYDSGRSSYARYAYIVGQRVNTYNWTWVSIVGYPFYYVTNTAFFAGTQNSWGIYGMRMVSGYGLGCFLRGLDGQSYSYSSEPTGSPGVVRFTWNASYYSNYYGVYPSPYQTSTRALYRSTLSTYHLSYTPNSLIFQETTDHYFAGGTYNHKESGVIHGSFTAIGLTRIPDIRITALGLLQYYRPTIYKSEYGASGTSRLVVLQLAQQGGA